MKIFGLLLLVSLSWAHLENADDRPSASCDGTLPYSGQTARVLGAGVIGLTNALLLQRVGFNVIIHAKTTPINYNPKTDSDPYYTSAKSGGWIFGESTDDYFVSTFDAFTGLYRTEPQAGIGLFPTIEYFAYTMTPQEFDEATPFKSYARGFRNLTQDELNALKYPNGTRMFPLAVEWITPIANPVPYLQTLMQRFIQQGGTYIHEHVNKVSDLTHKRGTDLVVICPGLGARTLGDLTDTNVVPIRGQMVVLKQATNPAERVGKAVWVDGWPKTTLIIPRSNGEVLVGGTFEINVNDLTPSVSTRQSLLQAATMVEPKLQYLTFSRDVVGLRPGLLVGEGPRIEVDNSFRVPVIYAYGHGSEGFEGSWGTGLEVLKLVNNMGIRSNNC